VIEKGMDADAILAALGKPFEVKPIQSDDKAVHAENWIYRRKLKETSEQVPDSQGTVPAYVGTDASGVHIADVPIVTYRNKHITTYQVTALLMINGKLELARQWLDEDSFYVD